MPFHRFALALPFLLIGLAAPLAAAAQDAAARVTPVFSHPLPNLPGKRLTGVLVEYAPGGASPAHRHAASAFITGFVLEGAIRSQVNDGPVRVYQAGESFTEMPGDRHAVSENASATAPARLLAIFVADAGETALTLPDRP